MKMLMEIDPLPMGGSLAMSMVMISPSRREVSPAEQLCRSPRLVPPRGGGVPCRKLAYDFFLDERLHIAEDGHRRATRGALALIFCQCFLLFPKIISEKFQVIPRTFVSAHK